MSLSPTSPRSGWIFVPLCKVIFSLSSLRYRPLILGLLADYKKVIARYSRLFLWTDWQFYSPFQIFERQATHRDLEIAAGPFSAVDMTMSAPLVGATEA